jgi:hypothetical protein
MLAEVNLSALVRGIAMTQLTILITDRRGIFRPDD